jgi:spore coat polysaccharide biosynthesis predicted glycosyltransferase SpsG
MVGPDQADSRPEDHGIFSDWIPVESWSSSVEDASNLVDLSRRLDACWAVLDDYRVDEAYQLTLRSAGQRWLQFDGAAQKPLWANIIINANPSVQARDYVPVLRNPEAHLLLGPRYAILRPEFSKVERRDPSRPVKRILVTFGGGDDRGAIEFVLSTLLPVTPRTVTYLVISGARNPRNYYLQEWVERHGRGRVGLFIDPAHVAPLFACADLAIMAGGTTTYEAACFELPMILITIAENQVLQAKAWRDLGSAQFLGASEAISPAALLNAYREIIEPGRRATSASLLCGMVDSKGGERIAKMLSSEIEHL